jgi:hypothetical protein
MVGRSVPAWAIARRRGVCVARGRGPWGASGAGAPLLGVIANGFKTGRRGGYGYDYAPAKSKPPAKSKQPSSESVSPNGAASAEEPVPTVKG